MQPTKPIFIGLEPYETEIGAPQGSNCVPLPALRSPDGRVMSRWTPSPEEREWIGKGICDVFITLHLGNGGYPPTEVQVLNPLADENTTYFRDRLHLDDQLSLRILAEELETARRRLNDKIAEVTEKLNAKQPG